MASIINDEQNKTFTALGSPGEVQIKTVDPTDASVATAQSAQTVSAGSSGYTAQQAGSSGYDAQQATAQGYQATTGTAEQAQATTREVTPQETVQHQLAGIIDANSPLLTRARTKAVDSMNSKGLLNSSMAIGAADAALYDYALPIAQFDAGVYGKAAQDNQMFLNQVAQFNVNQANAMTATNIGLINRASEFSADASNKAQMFNAAEVNKASAFTADASNRAQMFNVAEQNKASEFTADAANKVSMFNAQEQNKLLGQNIDNAFKASIAAADSATRLELQRLDDITKKAIADSDQKNKAILQTSNSAAAINQSAMDAIARIAASPDLTPAAKDAQIKQQIDMLNTSLEVQSSISGLNIDKYFTFAPTVETVKEDRTSSDTATNASGGAPAAASGSTAPAYATNQDWGYL